MTTTTKESIRKIYLYGLSGVGFILLTIGAVRLADTFLRAQVFQLPTNSYTDCQQDAEDSWQWRYREENDFDVFSHIKEPEKLEKPTEEEIAEFKAGLVEKCEKRMARQLKNWSLTNYSQGLTLALIGLAVWLTHFLALRKEEK